MVESLLKNASLLVLVLALGAALPVRAQTGDAPAGDAPGADDAASAESSAASAESSVAEGLAEPEPEVSDEVEAPRQAVQPSGVEESGAEESGAALGQAAPTVDEDLEAAVAEGEPATGGGAAAEGEEEGGSTADRLAQAVPNAGLPWSMPITAGYNMSTRTLNRGAQLTYSPFMQLSLNAAFRWNFGKGLLAGIVQGMNYELSTNQGTVNAGFTQPQTIDWPDTRLDITYTLPWKPLGVGVTTQLALFLPTSKFSRASNRALGLSPLLFVVKAFPVMQGLLVNGLWRYTGWTGDVTPVYSPNSSDRMTTADGRDVLANTGSMPIRHSNSAFLSVTLLPYPGFAASLSYGGVWLRRERPPGVTFDDSVVSASGEPYELAPGDEENRFILHNFTASISYDFTSYLTLGFSYDSFTQWYDDRGKVRHPFHDENTVFRFTLQFRPDFLTASLRASRDAAVTESDEAAAETVRRALPTLF